MLHTIFSKLDKRLFRPLCVAVASVVLAFSCIVPAQAVDPVSIAGLAISGVSLAKDVIQTYLDDSASNAEKEAALQGYKDHWISKDNISDKCFLTYDALCQIVIDLNNAGQPAKISSVTLGSNNVEYYVVKACGPFGYTSVQSQFGFGATSIWNNYGLFYSTSNRVLFCAQVNTDLSLDSCLTQLRLIQTNVVTIKNSLVNTIGSNLESLLTTCNTISTKLDTLTSVISNGKVLVDNSDVVSALYTDFASVMGILESVDTGSLDPTAKFPALTGLIALSTKTYELVQRIGFGIDDVVSAIQSIPAFDDTDIITAIQSIPAYDDSALVSAVTTISDQITEQFGEYESTYSFPNFSSSGQSAANNKTVSGVLPSAFTSINPGTRQLLYSPSGTLILPKRVLYNGGGDCKNVYCTPYIHQTYGLGYRLEFLFRFSRIQNTPRTETVQFPQVSFTDYSGETLTLYGYSGTVRVSPHRDTVSSYLYYFPRWDASGNWLGWSGQNDTFEFTSSSYEPSKRVYLTPPESGTYYIYCNSDTAIPVVYASRFTGFLQSQTDRVVNAVGSIPAPTDYTSQLTAVTGRMDDILAQLQSTSGSATCEHTYSQHMEQEATCILPGLMISTCSKCGDSSSEIVDPLGHDWQCTSHVDAVTDPDTGEETSSAYDIYTCSRCGDTYEDHTGTGAPDEDYSNTTISQLVVKVFSKLGTFAGKLLGSVVHLFDKAVNAVDDLASKFNDYVEQIKGFGENYPIWLSGFWGIIPAELQVALTFAVICMALGVVGKKLFFS